jgi:hypothetical protein
MPLTAELSMCLLACAMPEEEPVPLSNSTDLLPPAALQLSSHFHHPCLYSPAMNTLSIKPQLRLDEGAIKDVSRGEEEQVCSGWQHPVPNMIQPAHCKLASYCLRNTVSLYIYINIHTYIYICLLQEQGCLLEPS